MLDEEIKQIVLQNQATLAKIQRQLKWQMIGSIVKAILIIGPIVLGIILLMPFVQQYLPEFKTAMNTVRLGLTSLQTGGTVNGSVTPEQQELICNENLREKLIQQICR